MKKGDKVRYYKIARTKFVFEPGKGERKVLEVIPIGKSSGIFIGWSFLREGTLESDGDGFTWLALPKDIKVAVIEPLIVGSRYLKPVRVLPEDFRLLENK